MAKDVKDLDVEKGPELKEKAPPPVAKVKSDALQKIASAAEHVASLQVAVDGKVREAFAHFAKHLKELDK